MDIQQLKYYKILLIGDSCEDIYHFGKIKRLSPEAPVPIFALQYSESHPGMTANVKENLCSLGVSVDLITNKEKLTKERYIDLNTKQHLLRVDTGEVNSLCPFEHSLVNIDNLNEYDALVISDYNKGFITSESVEFLTNNFQGPIFVDSKKTDLSIFEQCFIKINEEEYKSVEKIPEECELIVTLGSKGTQWNKKIFSTKTVEVFDICGAGDTFFAAFICSYLINKKIENSIKFANKCATITVQKLGTYAPTIGDIINDK